MSKINQNVLNEVMCNEPGKESDLSWQACSPDPQPAQE